MIDLRLALPIELKRADVTGTGEFSGYASTFGGVPDSYGDILVKGAFTTTLRQHKTRNTKPSLLWHHRQDEPIGKWLHLEEDSHGLLASGKLTLETRRGAEAFALMKDDAVSLSIGFTVSKTGTSKSGGIREIREVEKLHEISVVAAPANTDARVISVKDKPATRREFEHLLRDAAGLSAREAKRAASGGWGSLVRQEQDTELDQVLDKIQAIHELLITR